MCAAKSKESGQGTSTAAKAAKEPKPPRKPLIGFVVLPDGFGYKDPAFLLKYACAVWKCEVGDLEVTKPAAGSKLHVVRKKAAAVHAIPAATKVAPPMTVEAVAQLIADAIHNRNAIEAAGPAIEALGKVPPGEWFAELADDLKGDAFAVKGDPRLAIVMAVIFYVGGNLKGNKRSDALVAFVQSLPDDLREKAAYLLAGGYVSFALLKKATTPAQPASTDGAPKT